MQQNTRFVIDDSARFMFAYLEVNEVQVLQAAGIPIDFFDRKSRSLTAHEYVRVLEALVEQTGSDRPIPLQLSDIPIGAAMSPPVLAALCSRDFAAFVGRIREFKPLIGPLVLELDSTEDGFEIEVGSVIPGMELHPGIVASEFVFFTKVIREATGCMITPVRVASRTPLLEKAYGSFFGVQPVAGPTDRIVFSAADARIPFSMRNESVWEYFEPGLRKRLDELEKDSTFAARVRAVLFEILPMGHSGIDDVASKIHMSNRTLQRRLQAEGTNFQQQLNHSRELLARHHLSSSKMGVSEISFLLGYEEPSSFSRAFHTWTGQSPETYRASALSA